MHNYNTQTTVETNEGEHITVRMATMTKYTQLWKPVKVNTSVYA